MIQQIIPQSYITKLGQIREYKRATCSKHKSSMKLFAIVSAFLASAVVCDVQYECLNSNHFAFTFDNGPGQYTPTLLGILDAVQVKATFHIVTQWLTDFQIAGYVKKIHHRGHLVGIRFNPQLSPESMSDEAIVASLVADQERIYKLIKVKPVYVRLPYNSAFNERVVDAVERAGFIVTIHNLESQDYLADSDANIQHIYDSVVSGIDTRLFNQSAILVQSDQNLFSVKSVTKLVQYIRDGKNYQIVTLNECLGLPAYK